MKIIILEKISQLDFNASKYLSKNIIEINSNTYYYLICRYEG